MRISISIKWTLSAVVMVILVVVVYAVFMTSDTQKSVEAETERIRTIQYEALDQIGSQTTRYISLPASSLLFDNDKGGLTKLLSPVVEKSSETSSYFAIYSMIIDPNGRVWTAAVGDGYDKLEFADTDFFDRSRDEKVIEEVSKTWLKKNIAGKSLPLTEDVERKLKTSDGDDKTVNIRQYAHEIEGNGEKQGYLIVGYSIDGLTDEIEKIREQGEIRKDAAINRSIWLALLAVVVGLVIAGIQAVLVTRNIKKLSKAADQIASGDLSVRSDVKSRDEIGQLGEQFNIMADRVQNLLMETEQKAMLEKEVDIARSIQTTLLPPCGFAQCGPVTLNGYFQPASVCGGDFWSYNQLPDGSVLLTMGDVTGHGVPSAMITACAKSALDTMLNVSTTQVINLPQMVTSLNAAICQTAKRTLFMTFIAIHISADARYAEVVNAGHNFPLHLRNNDVKGIVARGERLGDNPNARYEQIRFELAHGDMLLLYTDGLTEYIGPQGAEYGEKRLRKVIAPCGTGDVNAAMQHLQADFSAFCGNAPQADDITLMFAKV
ncbi:MAG: SpoIIE family protein phosphatase [Proteobacteria bacterium]|nr:SpoIIE family protein phosphatase [Pseudomonadota bacterium]